MTKVTFSSMPDMSKQAAVQDEIAKTKRFTMHSLSDQHKLDMFAAYSLVYFFLLVYIATSFLIN